MQNQRLDDLSLQAEAAQAIFMMMSHQHSLAARDLLLILDQQYPAGASSVQLTSFALLYGVCAAV